MDEPRTIEESYTSAGNASDLTVKSDQRGAADVLIAAGWTPGMLGGALMRLHSEWDGAAKKRRMDETETRNLGIRVPTVRGDRSRGASGLARAGKSRRSKHANIPVIDPVYGRFDSKWEHACWMKLVARQKAGEISELERQVPFELVPAQVAPISGKKVRPSHYIADFVFAENGRLRVLDAKGQRTAHYKDKWKQMLHVHGIEVEELSKK